jgi:hypothetical protein
VSKIPNEPDHDVLDERMVEMTVNMYVTILIEN